MLGGAAGIGAGSWSIGHGGQGKSRFTWRQQKRTRPLCTVLPLAQVRPWSARIFLPECCPPQTATHQALFSCALMESQDVCHCSVCCGGGSLRLTSCLEVRRELGAP